MSLINLFYKLKNNTKGSVIVFTALAMTVIVGFTALVTDVGLLYFNRVRLSNAADAAALAGAQSMANSDPEGADYWAKHYATQKGIDIPEENVEVEVDMENKLVTVTLNKEVFLCFARVLNFYSSNVAATAQATYEYPTKVTNISNGNVFPLFITEYIYEETLSEEGSVDENVTIELMGDNPGEDDDGFVKITKENGEEELIPGNWGALHFGDDTFTPALEGTLNKALVLEAETWYEDGTKTGTMGGEVRDAVDYRLDENNSVLTYGLIPVVDMVEDKGGGKVEVHIKSFAVLNLQGTEKDPPGWTIIGNLEGGKSVADFFGETTSDDDHDYGARVLRLID